MVKKSSDKERKIYDNLSKTIQQFVSGRRYVPMGQAALFKRLKIPASLHALCKEIIADLLQDGIIEIHKKQIAPKKQEVQAVTGMLHMHPRGFGFVTPDHPQDSSQDVFIPKHLTDGAVHGDKVEIVINPDSNWDKGPEGKIISIIKRGRTHLGCTIKQFDSKGNLLAYAPLLGISKPVLIESDEDSPLKIGDRIIVKVLSWGDEEGVTIGELSHHIGHISDPSCDIPAAIEEYDLHDVFPQPVIKEAKAFGKTVTQKDLKGRKNLTKIIAFTIDPETAKDYDDALSVTKDKKGHYHLGVHIADVAHYVKAMSALDREASERCNSTYFPGSCIPMLPEELSNQLCSLKAKVNRLTASVLMEFNPDGSMVGYEIVRAYINSAKRFTYEEAKEVIDGKRKSVHAPTLKLMVELCHLLKKKRYERGSIDFSLPDMVIEVDEKGVPLGVKTVEYDISHQLVEEFALKANETVAKHLSDLGKMVIYRIHEEPSQENREDFFTLARSLGFQLPDKPSTADIQKLFNEAKSTPYGQQLSVGFIRSMKLAFYSPDNVGHFGLSLQHYCHFTSPIRRYTDLIIQRLLFNEEDKDTDVYKIALKCSEQERVSFRAESSVKVLKKLRLLKGYLDEDASKEYSAVITRIKPFGVFFELPSIMLEGFLHISELEDDYFVFDPKRNILQGKSSGKMHAVGEPLKVRPTAVDFIALETKWELAASGRKKGQARRRR